jgi:hypothetical protein
MRPRSRRPPARFASPARCLVTGARSRSRRPTAIRSPCSTSVRSPCRPAPTSARASRSGRSVGAARPSTTNRTSILVCAVPTTPTGISTRSNSCLHGLRRRRPFLPRHLRRRSCPRPSRLSRHLPLRLPRPPPSRPRAARSPARRRGARRRRRIRAFSADRRAAIACGPSLGLCRPRLRRLDAHTPAVAVAVALMPPDRARRRLVGRRRPTCVGPPRRCPFGDASRRSRACSLRRRGRRVRPFPSAHLTAERRRSSRPECRRLRQRSWPCSRSPGRVGSASGADAATLV